MLIIITAVVQSALNQLGFNKDTATPTNDEAIGSEEKDDEEQDIPMAINPIWDFELGNLLDVVIKKTPDCLYGLYVLDNGESIVAWQVTTK